MKNKKNMRRFLSGFLAMLTVLSTILSPILSYAADVVPVPEEPPLYEEVKNELDADEVVKAKDLELETGSIFEVEKDFTGLEIPDEKKVKITFHEAKNEEKQDFTTDYEDTYKAVYYVEPVSGHPIYQINRKLIVKEAVVQVAESENQESVSNQEDENEAEGEEPAIGTAESEEPVQDEVNVEIPSEDGIYEEVTPTEIPVEEEPIDTPIPENPSEEVSTEEPAIDDNPDTDSTFEEITDTDPEEMPEATDDSFTDGTEKTEDADGNYQVNIVRGEEFHIELNHEDGQYQPGETVVFSGDMPQGSLIAVGTTKVQANQTENTEDLLYSEVTYHEESDKFSFEMPADDIDLSVSMDQAENGIMLLATDTPWDDATNIEANKYYYYSDGQLHPFDLVSSLVVKEDGNYDFSSAEPVVIGENGATEIFTNEKGYVKSIAIPYGTYLVRETTTPHNYKPVDDFIVRVTENKPTEPQTWRVLLDKEFSAKLKIIKQDDETKKSVLIPGTEFKIYDMDHEKYVEQVTTYPTTVTHISYFTDTDGYLILPQNLKIGHYRIEEVTAPDGYTINKNYVEIQVDTNTLYQTDPVSGDAIIEVVYENHPVKGKLTVQKKGEVLSTYKNDFKYEVQNLSGAVYEVYAAEDIYTADFQKDDTGKRILEYAKGAKIAELTTDESGKADLDNLPLGEYKVVEKTAPEGFVLNEEEQKVSFVYADQDTPAISQSAEFINDRQKVEVSVVKKDAENEKGLSGAEFGLYAKEDIKAGDKVLVKADELLTKAVTGEDGKTVFEQDLPFGIYYIKELAAPDGFVSSDEQIEVTAKYQGQEVKTVKLETVFKNEPTTTEFTKSDITTGVELDGATLTVLDSDGKEVEKWTSVKGKAHVIKRLHVGKTYTLREEFAPYGYLQAEEVKFTVSDTADVQKVEMKDAVPVGRIIINKKGEFVKEVTWKDMLAGGMDAAFGYVTGSLKDVTFEIYAAEDIKAADGESSDYYKKDELVATITTDALGYARSEDLPLGKYYVKEKETADGYVLDGEIREVDLTYRDQNTPVVTYDEDWQNNRQKAKVTVVKKEKNTDRVLEGGVFALYTKNDILNAEGEVILKADTMIEQKATDQDGRIVFTADLPINGSYYVKEVQAPAGFVTTEEIKEFDFAYAGEEVAEVSFEFTYEDEPTTFEITKSDITTGEELPGAKLKVSDSEGNVVDEWTSGSTPHIIKELEVGKKYTLTETIPADGYATAESIMFVVENTADIQKVEMQDDTTKILISKVDMTDGSSEVKGAKLYILNENQEVMESWTSGDQPHYVEKLPIGTYTLLEETAPKGYIVANKVTFEVKDTGDVQGAKMEDEQAMGKVILNKTDKDTKKPMKGVEFALCDSKGKVLETLVTDSAGHAESKNYPIATFKNGQYKKAITYILKETKTLDGYQLDETEHKIQFEYVNDRTPVIEYTLDLTNKKAPEKDTPETSENQGASTPVSHGSDATSVSSSPKTGDNTNIAIFVLVLAVSAGCLGTVVAVKRKRK